MANKDVKGGHIRVLVLQAMGGAAARSEGEIKVDGPKKVDGSENPEFWQDYLCAPPLYCCRLY